MNLKLISSVWNIDSRVSTDGRSPARRSICLNHHCRCEIIPRKAKLQPSGTPVSAVRCIVLGWARGQGNISAQPPTEDVRWAYIFPPTTNPLPASKKNNKEESSCRILSLIGGFIYFINLIWEDRSISSAGHVYLSSPEYLFNSELPPCLCVTLYVPLYRHAEDPHV